MWFGQNNVNSALPFVLARMRTISRTSCATVCARYLRSFDSWKSIIYFDTDKESFLPIFMASKVLTKGRRVVAYLPNLRAAVRRFATYKEQNSLNYYSIESGKTIWPDKNLGPLGPIDRRFTLPGSVGVSTEIVPETTHTPPKVAKVEPSTLSDRHEAVSSQLIDFAFNVDAQEGRDYSAPTATDMLECVAFDCPKTLVKDFHELFPEYKTTDGAITVITISQKTVNDMSTWSEAVEIEREEMLKTYIQGACELCALLQHAGFWADFIDPSCGKPFLGPSTNFSLHETDERYRSLGFHIDDLGCCKVIRHHLWGTHAYVGCLFTNAPIDHPVVMTMKQEYVEPGN